MRVARYVCVDRRSNITTEHGVIMKDFWSENSKIIRKLLLNQFGATFFGIMLYMSSYAIKAEKPWPTLLASCLATAFYLYLIYLELWERGGQDRIKIDGGRAVRRPLTGLYVMLIANIPNLILAILVLLSHPFKNSIAWLGNVHVISRAICYIWEGMYLGIVRYFSPNNPIIYLLCVFPAVFVGAGAYLLGLSNKRLLGPSPAKKAN